MITDLGKYKMVNNCQTLKELAEVIRSLASNGMIQGRTDIFNAENMALSCENFTLYNNTSLTREFGIRQQAMMLLYYGKIY